MSSIANPFALFELEAAFDIDQSALQRAYLAAQQSTHPDRLPATATSAERMQAMQRSMAVNDAYHALKSPLTRAQALLAMRGVRVGTESDTHKPSMDLLMEVMEWREALEEADLNSLPGQVADLQEMAAQAEISIGRALDDGTLDNAAQSTLRLQYLDKTLQDAKAKRRQLAARK